MFFFFHNDTSMMNSLLPPEELQMAVLPTINRYHMNEYSKPWGPPLGLTGRMEFMHLTPLHTTNTSSDSVSKPDSYSVSSSKSRSSQPCQKQPLFSPSSYSSRLCSSSPLSRRPSSCRGLSRHPYGSGQDVHTLLSESDSAEIIPPILNTEVWEQPPSQVIEITLLESWGNSKFIGLTGIEVISVTGEILPCSCYRFSATPRDLYSIDSRYTSCLLENVFIRPNLTTQARNMWLVPVRYHESPPVLRVGAHSRGYA